jgi:hypothetical protein
MATNHRLPFRELEAFSRSRLPVLLTFLHARIAGQESGLFQNASQLVAEVTQRARDAMLHRSRLSVHTATLNEDDEIKFFQGIRSLKRLLHDHSIDFIEEVLFEGLVIDFDVSRAGPEEYASRCCFSAARTVVLY